MTFEEMGYKPKEELREKKILAPSEEELAQARREYLEWQRSTPNRFSFWFPKIQSAQNSIVRLPSSRVVPVPEELLDAFFMDRPEQDEKDIRQWVHTALMPAIEEIPGPKRFLKNGCFSGKLCFRSACLLDTDDEEKVLDHVMAIQGDSLMYETNGNLEMVVREFVDAPEGTPEIYSGMPLRPEVRLFYDFDNHKVLYHVFYWDWDYCHELICARAEDQAVYEAEYDNVRAQYERLTGKHLDAISSALATVTDLEGVWSVDFILEEDRVWLIDMATAETSAYWNPEKCSE